MIISSSRSSQSQQLLIALILGVLAYVISQVVVLNCPLTTDEGSYLFQAHNFSRLQIALPAPAAKTMFFHEMNIMDDSVGWLSRYSPGHALWLTPGVLAGEPRFMVALAAVVSCLCISAAGIRLGLHKLMMPLLLLCSPFFLFMHATLLSHTSGLAAVSVMLWAYIRWKQEGKAFFAALAGLAWAFFFLNRSFSALLLAAPFGIDALVDLLRLRTARSLSTTLLFAVSAILGGILYLGYNYLAVGDPFTPTYLYYEPSDNLGFGSRHIQDGTVHHTLVRGIENLWQNLLLLDKWLFGIRTYFVLFVVCLVGGWRRRWSGLFLGVIVSVAVGYIFFWYKGVSYTGPVYYFELLPFILLSIGFGLQCLGQQSWIGSPHGKGIACLIGILCLFQVGSFFYAEGKKIRDQQATMSALHRVIESAPENSMVFVDTAYRGLHRHVKRGLAFNPQGEESDPLIALTGAVHPKVGYRSYPGKQYFHIQQDGEQFILQPLETSVPLNYSFSSTQAHSQVGQKRVTENGKGEIVIEQGDGSEVGYMVFGMYRYLVPGEYILAVDIEVTATESDKPVTIELAQDQGQSILIAKNLGDLKGGRYELPFTIEVIGEVEPRIHYGGSGSVTIGDMCIIEKQKPME